MKTITIRQLHKKTGEWLRQIQKHGEITITDRGKPIAKIVSLSTTPEIPYFARRKLTPEFAALAERLCGGTDSTIGISEDREDRYI